MSDPEATLREWKASMQAEHEESIRQPDPDVEHGIEAVAQVSYEVEYALDDGDLTETSREQVADGEPELFSCVCGVRGMTREEAVSHLQAL